ncbi:MAG: CbiQ family ECF transporter T component [Gammaproteobacteria bacterium]
MVDASERSLSAMHPAIRILCFLGLVSALAHANLPFIIAADGLFLFFAIAASGDIFAFTWRLVRRMRWFWLSIILLYTFMTPGGGQTLVLGPLDLSLGGLILGLTRCLALLTVLLFFALLIHTTPATRLQGALFWLLQPLRFVGVPANRLSIRIALTLEKIHELQTRWASRASGGFRLSSWREIPERIAALVHEVFIQAERKPTQTQLTLETSAPTTAQWFLLILLLALMTALRLYTTYYL